MRKPDQLGTEPAHVILRQQRDEAIVRMRRRAEETLFLALRGIVQKP